jgi:hypothetical protein
VLVTTYFLTEPYAYYASTAQIPDVTIGCIASDRSAILGRQNWCYIYEGTNAYWQGYTAEYRTAQSLAQQWGELIEQRHEYCQALGVDFIQVIVPNKLSVIPEFFPQPLAHSVTPVFEALLSYPFHTRLVSPLAQWRDPSLKEVVFRRNDSHLTMAGNAHLAYCILDSLHMTIPAHLPPIVTKQVQHIGDLGSKFAPPITETFSAPLWDQGLFLRLEQYKVNDVTAEGFNGIEQVFVHPNAPIKKRVLVCGNSFFERTPSWGLSPFFVALFEYFHFIWTPNLELNALHTNQFDLVICQTCERFMLQLPTY